MDPLPAPDAHATAAAPPDPTTLTGHVVVCGADHLAVRTVVELQRRGEQAVVIGPAGTDAADLGLDGVPVVHGDHRLPRILRMAGADRASAVLLTTDDDLGNLDAALAVREVNADARLVIRLFDTALAAHLEHLFPNARVLSSSALAAPGFVSAAVFGDGGERFEIGGRILVARPPGERATGPAPERVIPIATIRTDRTVELLPLDDAAAGGTPVTIEVHDPVTVAAPVVASAPRIGRRAALGERVRDMPEMLRARLAPPERRLTRFMALLVGLFVVSAIYFLVTARVTPLDAVSYAITLLTGASLITSIDPATAPAALRVYAIFLSLIGAALVAVVYAFITDALIGSRLMRTLGRRTVPRSIHDHVIVCGLGSIGYRTAIGIAELGVPVVAVDPEEDGRFVAAARALGIPVVIGDARQPEILAEVAIGRARAIVAATSNDLVNLSAALNAREIRPDLRVVLRLYDPEFAVRVQRGFGIRFTRSVSHLSAPAFAAAALGTDVVATLPVGDRRMLLFARFHVPGASALVGRAVTDLQRAGECRVIAVADPGSEAARWDGLEDEVLDADEEVVVIATRAGLAGLLELTSPRAAASDPR